jgi:5'-phosphate synthase pdxT subunit
MEGVFIRAPLITRWGEQVEVLAAFRESPVFVREKNVLVTTFHPELSESTVLHESFLKLCQTAN